LQDAIHHAFLSILPTLAVLGMKEEILDKKERDDFAAKVEAEGKNPNYHWYSDMYTPLESRS
jgi:hypothetical protein